MKLPVYKFDVDYFMHTFCLFARLVYCGNVILYNLHNKSQNPLTDQSQNCRNHCIWIAKNLGTHLCLRLEKGRHGKRAGGFSEVNIIVM